MSLTINLGTAATFGVLGGTTVTNTGATIVHGDLGVSPGAAVVGFPPGAVTGGSIYAGNPTAAQAQLDLTSAYLQLAAQPPGIDPTAGTGELGGLTLTPGTYTIPVGATINGTLTLNNPGNFIFQCSSSLITGIGAIITGTADAHKIFFQVTSSATLGAGTTFKGSIVALTAITANSGANVSGRLLARTAAVTLDTNNIVIPPFIIRVTYTPQVSGCHIICYGQTSPNTDVPCCITDSTLSVVGTPKTFDISIGDAICDVGGGPVTYVQPIPDNQVYAGTVRPCCDTDPFPLSVSWGPVIINLSPPV